MKPAWSQAQRRREQLDDHINRQKKACFGFRTVPADEKARWVRRHFDSIATKYDFMNSLLSFGIHHAWKREAVRMLGLLPGNRVIDVCGGTGDLALLASRAVGPSGAVAIYDINREMMEAGRHKIAGHGIRCFQGDAEKIAFSDASFDAAIVGFGIRNVTHMEAGFREMYRVLKPGGRMICLEFSKPVQPVFRWLYDQYSFRIMPFLGELLAGSRQAYTHLPETIRLFPLPHELSDILRKIGFSRVTYRRLTNGIAVIHRGIK